MLVAVVGGNLQGVEATYLARKAGWEVILIDKNSNAPASGLCDYFIQGDVTDTGSHWDILQQADIIIPALENLSALKILQHKSRKTGTPLAFDSHAYSITSSKLQSNQLFSRLDIATPEPYPECKFPVIVKPDASSGSRGVHIFEDISILNNFILQTKNLNSWVIQEFVSGPSCSLEVIGSPGNYHTLTVTDLFMDAQFDCKRVAVPTAISSAFVKQFEKISLLIAERLELTGIMDVEVIEHEGSLKVLEIDARLPSQTPTAVFWSTGINMVALLGKLYLKGKIKTKPDVNPSRAVIYEHLNVSKEKIEVAGEHIMSQAGPLTCYQDFFGADEAITNYQPDEKNWAATMIYAGNDINAVQQKRETTLENIQRKHKGAIIRDTIPAV
jgi:pyrrolysine biosynthesis protein PylC